MNEFNLDWLNKYNEQFPEQWFSWQKEEFQILVPENIARQDLELKALTQSQYIDAGLYQTPTISSGYILIVLMVFLGVRLLSWLK